MADYLLDTNHASPLVTPTHPLRARVLEAMAVDERFGITVPCITEAIYGFGIAPRGESNRRAWSLLVRDFTVYVPDAEETELAADLQISLRRQGWQLGTIDALAAVVALRNDLILLTTDRDFSRVPGLHCENWLETPTA